MMITIITCVSAEPPLETCATVGCSSGSSGSSSTVPAHLAQCCVVHKSLSLSLSRSAFCSFVSSTPSPANNIRVCWSEDVCVCVCVCV